MASSCSLCHGAHDEDAPCPPARLANRSPQSTWAETSGKSSSGWEALRRRTGSGRKPFEARFPGRCPECCEQIHEGDMVVYDGDGDVVHEDCA